VARAGVPGRGEPGSGELACERILPAIVAVGYRGWIGPGIMAKPMARSGA
jgi:hydroxypyruvate isomerase